MLSDGIRRYAFVEWNPTGSMGTQESIHVRRNHWSCGKPNLRQVQYKRNMPRS